MNKTDIIRDYIELQQDTALVILTEAGPTELINSNEDTTDMDLDICKESIRIILDSEILDACVMPVGRKYIRYENKLIFVDKLYQVDSDEHTIATYEEPKQPVRIVRNRKLAESYARRYEEIYNHAVDIKVEWDTDDQLYLITINGGRRPTLTYRELVDKVKEGEQNV